MTCKLRPSTKRGDPVLEYQWASETWRFYAYVNIWIVFISAMLMTRKWVVPYLAAGPEIEGDTCGPFAYRENSSLPDVKPGEGFDFYTETHLQDFFGFSNICTNWDYTPARELTAMIYPIFEYSLMIYLGLDFLATKLSYQRGELNEWFWTFSKIIFPLNVFLGTQFRMIFVCIAYEQVQQHTAGFLGFQVVLVLVAIQNTLFIIDSNIVYPSLGGIKKTRMAAITYLCCVLFIGFFKIRATIYVVQNAKGADWTLKDSPIPNWKVGQLVDRIWMIINAIMPLGISYYRSKNEAAIKFTITSEEPSYVGHEDDEVVGLTTGGGHGGTKYEAVEVSI